VSLAEHNTRLENEHDAGQHENNPAFGCLACIEEMRTQKCRVHDFDALRAKVGDAMEAAFDEWMQEHDL